MSMVSISEFADRLSEVMPVLMKEFARRQVNELYKDKITLPQFLVLEFLDKEAESKMSDLAHFMNVTTAAMTGIVERLVRDGYCVRVDDPQDRRIIKARLTVKGNGLLKKIHEERRRMTVKIFGRISEGDRQNYLKTLLQIKDILIQGNV